MFYSLVMSSFCQNLYGSAPCLVFLSSDSAPQEKERSVFPLLCMFQLSLVDKEITAGGEKKIREKALEAFVTYLPDHWSTGSHLTLAVL